MTRRRRVPDGDLYRCRGCGGWRIRDRVTRLKPCPTCRIRALRESIERVKAGGDW